MAQCGEASIELGHVLDWQTAGIPQYRAGRLLLLVGRRAHRCFEGSGAARGLGGRILRRALGLQLRGVEDAITAVGADGQRLRIVLEGIGWRLHAGILTGSACPARSARTAHVCRCARSTGRHVAGHAQMPRICLGAHVLQFADRDVVALVRLGRSRRARR